MMDRRIGLAALDIEKYSKIGTQDLQNNQLDKALDAFKYAYKRSHELDDGYTERACAFNLGAAYIAMGQPKRGLEVLQKAVPPENKKEGKSNGDLYFNFGLGCEGLGNYEDAARNYAKALDEYRAEGDNLEMEAETLEKLGQIYSRTKNAFAADTYGQLVSVYEQSNNPANYLKQMKALYEKSTHLHQAGKKEDSASAADECLKLAEKCGSNNDVGNILNDLGLIFTQLQKYDRALTCFEQALPMIRTRQTDKKQEAVILQNLGATYNFLGDYQRAVGFHENAAKLYAELKNRNSQGQCFANLAFAFSQLKDPESAGEAFLHAYQAAVDTGDKRTQWQVTEGLGAVAFNKGQINKAILYFKQALSILSTCDPNHIAQDRIVGKLTHALQVQVMQGQGHKYHPHHVGKINEILEEKPHIAKKQHAKVEQTEDVESSEPVIKYGRGERFIPVARKGSLRQFSKVARGISTPSLPGSAGGTLRRSMMLSASSGSSSRTSSVGSSDDSDNNDIEKVKREYNQRIQRELEEDEREYALGNARFPSAKRKLDLDKEKIQEEVDEGSEESESSSGEEEDFEGEVKEKHENEEDEDAEREAVKEQMRKISLASEGEHSDEEESDGESDDDDEDDQSQTDVKRPLSPKVKVEPSKAKSSDSESETDTAPQPPTQSPMPTSSLVRTYDQPEPKSTEKVSEIKSVERKSTKYADIAFETPLGTSGMESKRRKTDPKLLDHPNYFQSDSEEDIKSKEEQTMDKELRNLNLGSENERKIFSARDNDLAPIPELMVRIFEEMH